MDNVDSQKLILGVKNKDFFFLHLLLQRWRKWSNDRCKQLQPQLHQRRQRGLLEARRGYSGWHFGDGPLPGAPTMLLLPQVGMPLGWPWKPPFMEATLHSVTSLTLFLGLGHVPYVEMATDFEAHTGTTLP